MDHSIDSDRTLSAEAQVDVSADSDIAVARRVLRTEADALMDLAAGLDDRFARSVGVLAGITGRVVVTGMGKSAISRGRSRRRWPPPARRPSACIRGRPATAISA